VVPGVVRYTLPPAFIYEYPHVSIDLGSGTATHLGGREVALEGQVYDFLTILLASPGRVHTYWQLARELLPDLAGRHDPERRWQSWNSLDWREQVAIKRALYTLAYRTRLVLGERPGDVSILVNRMNLGYALRRPLRVVPVG
jgi:hypothetical protein